MVVSERSAVANRLSYQPANRLETGCKEAGITAEAVREAVTGWMAVGVDRERALKSAALEISLKTNVCMDRARRLVQLAYVGS